MHRIVDWSTVAMKSHCESPVYLNEISSKMLSITHQKDKKNGKLKLSLGRWKTIYFLFCFFSLLDFCIGDGVGGNIFVP